MTGGTVRAPPNPWSRLTLRIYVLKVSGTLTSAFNRADKLRLRLRSGRLLPHPPEQFQSEIALIVCHCVQGSGIEGKKPPVNGSLLCSAPVVWQKNSLNQTQKPQATSPANRSCHTRRKKPPSHASPRWYCTKPSITREQARRSAGGSSSACQADGNSCCTWRKRSSPSALSSTP